MQHGSDDLWKKIGVKGKVPTLESIGPKSLNKMAWEPGCKSHESIEIARRAAEAVLKDFAVWLKGCKGCCLRPIRTYRYRRELVLNLTDFGLDQAGGNWPSAQVDQGE